MDLWDLTRLLFRRWYFALPILLVSAIVAVLVANSVDPDYRATGNAVLIPAPGDPADAEARAQNKPVPSRPKNPWGDLGFNALGQAAILQVMDQVSLEQLRNAGLSDSITVQMDVRSPIFIVEAVGRTPAQATATVREVIKQLTAEVAAQQASYGVMPQDTITTRTLTDGADVETVTSKVKRVLVVTVGIGLLLTAGGTIGLDVLLRWRRSRRDTGEAPPAVGSAAPDDDEPGQAGNGRAIRPHFVAPRPSASSEETQIIGRIPTTRAATGADGSVQLAKAARPPAGRAHARGTGRSSVRIENSGSRRPAEQADENNAPTGALVAKGNGAKGSTNGSGTAPGNAEATIILPIPRGQWSNGSDDRNGGR